MKKFTLLLVLLLGVTGVNAKTKTTTLWEGTYTNNIGIPVADLVQGATITVSATVTASDKADDKKLRVFYCKNDENWTQTSFTDISDWVELSVGETSHSFTVTEAAMNILNDNTETTGSRGIMYIGANNKDYLTITKITQTETLEPTSESEIPLSGDWESSTTSAKIFDPVSDARIGDVLQFTVSTTEAWKWVQFKLTDKDGEVDQFTGDGSEPQGNNANTSFTLEFIISNLDDLKKIKNDGFGVIQTGDNAFTMTAVNLLTYSDSYGYTTITIPEVGYATWSSDKKYDFKSAGLQAYYASDVTTGSVTLTPMDITWDWQGYIIKGSAGEYDVLESLTTDGSSYYPSTNYLKQNINEGTVYRSEYSDYSGDAKGDELTNIKTKYRYIFSKSDSDTDGSTIGFYRLTGDHTLGANKAYLETTTDITPKGNNARVNLDFGDESETTGIDNVDVNANENIDAPMYNLAGQRIGKSYKGIVIVNGKKYFNK